MQWLAEYVQEQIPNENFAMENKKILLDVKSFKRSSNEHEHAHTNRLSYFQPTF